MSDYTPYHRKRSHWLLRDGTTIREPVIEASPAGRNVRIAGSTSRVSRHDLGSLLGKWVTAEAKKRETVPVYNLGGDPSDPEDTAPIIARQTGSPSTSEEFLPFTKNQEMAWAHWLFKHPTLPVYARVELAVRVRSGTYTKSTPYAETSITFAPMPEREGSNLAHGTNASSWDGSDFPYNAMPAELRSDAEDILRGNEVTWGRATFTNATAAMSEAIRRYRELDALSELRVPNLRQARLVEGPVGTVGEDRLLFERTFQPDSYLGEMVQYVEAIEPATKLVELWGEMVEVLKRQGVILPRSSIEQALHVLLGTGAQPAQVVPYLANRGGVEPDDKHTVHVNLYDGVVAITCQHRPQDLEADVLAYEIARERASITGETDLMEAFLSSVADYRKTEDVERVVRASRHT